MGRVGARSSYALSVVDRIHPSKDVTLPIGATRAAAVPDVLAAIDIGTNSVHMVVARLTASGRFEVITRHKETVRLGETGEDQLRHLTPEAMDRGIAALTRCRAVLDKYDAPVKAVATSAVREAENRKEFIRRARKEAGIEVEVIAGHEEARLIQLGVLQALPVYETPLLLCDIGGGSTELLLGLRGQVRSARSFKLGAIRVTQRFFPDGVTSQRSVDRARRFIRGTIVPFARETAAHGFEVAVGSSGTIENLLTMSLGKARRAELQSINGVELTRDALDGVLESLLEASTPQRRAALSGIDPDRADIIVGGALILEQVMDVLGIERFVVSENALREGALFDLASRISGATADHLSDLRRRSIDHLMEACDEDPEHSIRVADLALQLFDGTESLHGLGHDEREWLEAGALLANVGLFIAHSRHHHHSYYVIRNSELLAGFTDEEIEIIAQVARYHRRGEPTIKHLTFAALDDADRERVRWMAALLRVAIGLDRSHAGVCDHVKVVVEPTKIVITPLGGPGADLSLEVFSARERSGLLERMVGRPIEIDA